MMRRTLVGSGLAGLALLATGLPAQAAVRHGWQVGEDLGSGNFAKSVDAMAASGPRDIWAFGGQLVVSGGLHGIPWAQHYDGRKWTTVRLPSGPRGYFYAAAAVSSKNIWAFGAMNNTMAGYFTAHYDGKHWTYLKGGKATFGNQVAVVGSRDVWVAQSTGQAYQYLLRWTGSSWHRYTVPGTMLGAVAGLSSNDVWAAGLDINAEPEVLHFDGTRWRVVTVPKAPSVDAPLIGILPLSKTSVFAVGSVYNAQGGAPLVLHDNGPSWSVVDTSAFSQTGSLGTPVSDGHGGFWAEQDAPSDMASQEPGYVPMVHFSNGHLTKATLPKLPGLLNQVFQIVTVPGSHDLWAPANYQTSIGGNWGTLLLHYTP
jgi:hypothetical protein